MRVGRYKSSSKRKERSKREARERQGRGKGEARERETREAPFVGKNSGATSLLSLLSQSILLK
jgi:hypothetical protein